MTALVYIKARPGIMITVISFVPVWALVQESAEQLGSPMARGVPTGGVTTGNWCHFTGRST